MAEEQTPAEGQVEETAPVEGQAEVTPPSLSPEEFLAETKFKDLSAAQKSIKEAQATITKQAQEKKDLEAALQGATAQSQRPPVPKGQVPDFFDDPEGNVRREVDARVAQALRHQKAANDVETLKEENPEKFAKLESFMKQIYQQKPYLENMGKKGLRQAMTEAESVRKNYIKTIKAELMEDGDDDVTNGTNQSPKDKLRAEILAEIEQAKGATTVASGVRAPTADKSKKIIAARDKGDVDGVLDEIFGT